MTRFTKAEQEANVAEWVAALRSGKYKQRRAGLCHKGEYYCCLGVACELNVERLGLKREENEFGKVSYDGNECWLPPKVRTALGLKSISGEFGRLESLAGLNDAGRWFDEIADIIESRPEGLFE